jgi:hypothetical protein
MVFTRPGAPTTAAPGVMQLQHERALESGEHLFRPRTDARPVRQDGIPLPRLSDPPLLTHPFEMGMMLWL